MFPLSQIFSDSSFLILSKFGMIFYFSSILHNLDNGPYMQLHALEGQFCCFSSPVCCSCCQTCVAAMSREHVQMRCLSERAEGWVPLPASSLGSPMGNTEPVSLHAWCSPGPSCFVLLPCLCWYPSFPSRQWDSWASVLCWPFSFRFT